MIPVDQTTFGYPTGNCFSAAVASILELPITDVPPFMHHDDWWGVFHEWLRPRGYYAICLPTPEDNEWWPAGYHIASGLAARGFDHAVVAYGDQIVHDPHPHRSGLLTVKDVTILVPLDAGRMSYRPSGSSRPLRELH